MPVILTGDFNTPSWRDWQVRTPPVNWPVSRALEAASLTDSFRAVHPDPGTTWTAGHPYPYLPPNETSDRIDQIWTANMRAGGSVLIRVLSPAGGPYTASVARRGGTTPLTGIAEVDPADGPTIRLSTIGLPAGDQDAVMTHAEGAETARNRFAIIPADGTASLAVTATFAPGADIPVPFTGAPGVKLYWIGTCRPGEASVHNCLGFASTGARINGSLTCPACEFYAELTPRDPEARLIVDDHYQVLAIAPFAVKQPQNHWQNRQKRPSISQPMRGARQA